MLPKISIVIPCYNAANTIERTVKSLINQHYPNLELILMDGGSNDGTMKIIESYKDYFSQVISEPDSGQANALNKGFKLATGEIWGWLCADDEFTAGALLYFAKLFQNQPEIDLITAGCKRIFADGSTFNTKPRSDAMERIAYHNGIEQPSTLWRSTLHQKAGELDESYNYAFDWFWWNQLKQANARVLITDRVVSRYYFTDTNKTSTGSRFLIDEMYRVIKFYGPIRGYLADVYLFLYKQFDLAGYYDKSPYVASTTWVFNLIKNGHNPFKILGWLLCLLGLSIVFGRDRVLAYNWNFASKQERNLCWYKYSSIESELSNTLPEKQPIDLSISSVSKELQNTRLSNSPKPRIAIDCCCFHSRDFEGQRIWNLLFQEWSKTNFARQIILIDRNKTAPQLYGFSYYDLPEIDRQQPGNEALTLQQICDREQIDVFLSTGDTIPIQTPSIAFLRDTRLKNLDPIKNCAIYHASKYLIVHHQMIVEIGQKFPHINPADIISIPPNIDELVSQSAAIRMSKYPISDFQPIAASGEKLLHDGNLPKTDPSFISHEKLEIANFRRQYDLDLPYLLLVDRTDEENEEYGVEFFRAFARFVDRDRYAIVWANKRSPLSSEINILIEDHPFFLIQLDPTELRLAYAGAITLIAMNPAAELTILEAIFCDCPVIVNQDSSIKMLLGNAALYANNQEVDLLEILDKIQDSRLREQLIRQGFDRTQNFSGDRMAANLAAAICNTYQQIQDRQLSVPNPIWQSFRELQIATDIYSDNLMEIQDKLLQAQATILSMKTTKFWKIREQWFKIKRRLKLTNN
jgi:glycosyltransferase involved in cell wall biosynthesis